MKAVKMIEEDLVPLFKSPADDWFNFGRTGGYLRECRSRAAHMAEDFNALINGTRAMTLTRSHEYGSAIIEAMETNQPAKINGNVSNLGLITNLPEGCTVEVPCLVDANGIQPTPIGDLPPQLAALNRTNINVQDLVVEASLSGETDAVYHAVMLDPLTSAVCTLPQIHAMVSELLEAQKQWLPQFN